MSLITLEDDIDANITHFAHRSEFLKLLALFLQRLDEDDEETLDELVKSMGAIVSCHSTLLADFSSINISHYLAYWILHYMRSFLLSWSA